MLRYKTDRAWFKPTFIASRQETERVYCYKVSASVARVWRYRNLIITITIITTPEPGRSRMQLGQRLCTHKATSSFSAVLSRQSLFLSVDFTLCQRADEGLGNLPSR